MCLWSHLAISTFPRSPIMDLVTIAANLIFVLILAFLLLVSAGPAHYTFTAFKDISRHAKFKDNALNVLAGSVTLMISLAFVGMAGALIQMRVDAGKPRASQHLEGKIISFELVEKPPIVNCLTGAPIETGARMTLVHKATLDRPSNLIVRTAVTQDDEQKVLIRTRQIYTALTNFSGGPDSNALPYRYEQGMELDYPSPLIEKMCFKDGTWVPRLIRMF
jgi:hypothetical protein